MTTVGRLVGWLIASLGGIQTLICHRGVWNQHFYHMESWAGFDWVPDLRQVTLSVELPCLLE